MRFLPTEAEVKLLRQYERERQPLEELTAEDRFMLLFSKVERLTQRMAGMAFLGNFQDNLQMLTPVQLSPESWGSTVHPPPTPDLLARFPAGPALTPSRPGMGLLSSSSCLPATQRYHCRLCLCQVLPEAEADVGGGGGRGRGCGWSPGPGWGWSCAERRACPEFLWCTSGQIILALGNYMNSSKRGAVSGFKLQSLDLVRG